MIMNECEIKLSPLSPVVEYTHAGEPIEKQIDTIH